MEETIPEGKNYKVITPAGNIYTKYSGEAAEYKRLYGYPYVRLNHPKQ